MNSLTLDTETTGLPLWRLPADHPDQPRMANLAMIGVKPDGTESVRVNYYIKPVGWIMPDEVADIHGLTTDFLNENGVPVKVALDHYIALIKEGYAFYAFNAQFDLKILRGELRRAQMDDLFEQTPNACLMRACTNICKILKKDPRTSDDWKYPTLKEALAHFELKHDTLHRAMADAHGADQIRRKLIEIGMLPEAKVHHATTGAAKQAYDARHKPAKRPVTPPTAIKRAVPPRQIDASDDIPE